MNELTYNELSHHTNHTTQNGDLNVLSRCFFYPLVNHCMRCQVEHVATMTLVHPLRHSSAGQDGTIGSCAALSVHEVTWIAEKCARQAINKTQGHADSAERSVTVSASCKRRECGERHDVRLPNQEGPKFRTSSGNARL